MHIETISAYLYYGAHSTGAVIVVNGHPAFHGTWQEAREFRKRLTERLRQDKTEVFNK